MAVAADGRLAGSVSGGCVEGAVICAALTCLETGERRLESFRASETGEADFTEVGLACGGGMDVLVSRLQPRLFAIEWEASGQGTEYVRVTLMGREDDACGREALKYGSLPDLDFVMTRRENRAEEPEAGAWQIHGAQSGETDRRRIEEAAKQVAEVLERGKCVRDGKAAGSPGTGEIVCGGYRFFYHRVLPKPTLICVGGVHISVDLTRMAKSMGYRTVVIDPRGVFSTEDRFPWVDELRKEWPQQAFSRIPLNRTTALCALSHDPKIDVPALAAALRSPAFYIGCLGRTTTQQDRYEELVQMGFSDREISRVFGPIGLNLGGREPSEIALSILAEITMVRYGGGLPSRTMVESAGIGAAERIRAVG